MTKSKDKIVLIGAGNVATHLGKAFVDNGFQILQVYSRTEDSAKQLAEKLQADFTTDLERINREADLYVFSVKDAELTDVLENLPELNGLFVHTAGSVPMSVFADYHAHYGVIYPLQTFSKIKEVDFRMIPLFIEANSLEDESRLRVIASELSDSVTVLSSEKRKYLHLAAVFACNFVNHLYYQASQILESQDLSRDLLFPLILETADKVKTLHPLEAQTGPAVRYDTNVIEKHLQMLENAPEQQEIYRLLSDSIFESTKKN